jgi:hypothetical protein
VFFIQIKIDALFWMIVGEQIFTAAQNFRSFILLSSSLELIPKRESWAPLHMEQNFALISNWNDHHIKLGKLIFVLETSVMPANDIIFFKFKSLHFHVSRSLCNVDKIFTPYAGILSCRMSVHQQGLYNKMANPSSHHWPYLKQNQQESMKNLADTPLFSY